MWSCPGNMPKYYPGLRDILLSPTGRVICLSELGNILAYYLDKTTLLYKYICTIYTRLDTCLMSISRFSLRDKVTLRLLKLYFNIADVV